MFPESDVLCSFVCIYFTENFLSKLIRSLNSKWATFPKEEANREELHIYLWHYLFEATQKKKKWLLVKRCKDYM